MTTFNVPTREEVSPKNQQLFDQLNKGVGFVPNLFATFAHSENALGNYLSFSGAKTSLNNKEKEVINLVVSQLNSCDYCLSAHTAIGKMNGFSDEQVLEIRTGEATFDAKLNALATAVKAIVETKGKPDADTLEAFFAAGYTKENLVDALLVIGEKYISNFLHGITQIPIDFPLAPELELAHA